ncbi:MAG: hypothetical protein PHC75_06510 [Burkholderiales bacterium]|nr:hypothetical protein [Burkholderiales bacterium]
MIRVTCNKFKKYCNDISEINLNDFNAFIFRAILKSLVQTNNIIPITISLIVVVFTYLINKEEYFFLPQTNLTTYITFILLELFIGILTLFLCPILIVIGVNYVLGIIQNIKKPHGKLLFSAKAVILLLAYALFLKILINASFKLSEQILIMTIWAFLYFLLVNMYLSYKEHNHPFKFSATRVIFVVIFTITMVKPLDIIITRTSKTINYLQVNSLISMPTQTCRLLAKSKNKYIAPENNILNNTDYFESTPEGCNFYGGVVRVGFSSDYAVTIRKNILPVNINNKQSNIYDRVNCYSSTCFIETNITIDVNHDAYQKLFDEKHHGQEL